MNNTALITIIVPVYNVEKYLSRCINSLINQTYQNLEIILVDDGSPDNSGHICDEYAAKDSRIKVIHKVNGGLSDARNVALDETNGDYVLFVDSDDWIEKSTCEQLLRIAAEQSVEVVCFGYRMLTEQKTINTIHVEKSLRLTPAEAIDKIIYRVKKNCIANYVCNKFFAKQLFNNVRFPKGLLFEDQGTTYKLLHNAKMVYVSDSVFYNYFQHSGSITSGWYRPKAIHDRIVIWKERLGFIQKYYPDLKDKQIALLIGEIFVGLIKLRYDANYSVFINEIWNEYKTIGNERKLAKYNRKVWLHKYCYPLFWFYVKYFLK